jgi:hypothetical protein
MSMWPGITYREDKFPFHSSHCYGHKVTVRDGKWVFEDNGEEVIGHCRECPKCGQPPIEAEVETGDGIDACVGGFIDGVNAMCCGHGTKNGYVMLMRGWRL